jgi:hypothetical protein
MIQFTSSQPHAPPTGVGDERLHESRLLASLSKHCREKVCMDKDGNCAFSSIAYCLKTPTWRSDDFATNLLERTQISRSILAENLTSVSDMLRKAFVVYICENVSKYHPMTTNLSQSVFLYEARKFENDAVFTGQIGDLVIPVMADMLRCPIVLLTSIVSTPILPIFPETLLHDIVRCTFLTINGDLGITMVLDR